MLTFVFCKIIVHSSRFGSRMLHSADSTRETHVWDGRDKTQDQGSGRKLRCVQSPTQWSTLMC